MATYLVGFTMQESSTIMSGLAYSGNEADQNDRIKACNLYNLEFSYRVKDFLGAWNMSVQAWLKYYVFLRMLPNDRTK